jgi:HEAT repeat protein
MPPTTERHPAPTPEITARRRAAALAGHRGDHKAAVLARQDPAPAVRAAALGALVRLGDVTAGELTAGLQDPAAEVRARAAELCAASGPAVAIRMVPALVAAVGDDDPQVVESGCFAMGEIGASAGAAIVGDVAVAAVASVARQHPDPLCREAAVAALGAIGAPAGLAAILAGTVDKPAVRRRAVLALASFSGPEVDEALARAGQDRDWQVRQAAEDLTDRIR